MDPAGGLLPGVDEKQIRKHFEEFFEDVFSEMMNFGEIQEMCVAGNLGDHLIGNTYIQFHREEDAEKALQALAGRFYAGRPLMVEFSPVTDFREARCRSYDEATCNRGGHCNFLHLMPVSRRLMRHLFEAQKKQWGKSGGRDRSRSRDRGDRGREPNWRRAPSPSSADRKDQIAQMNADLEKAAAGAGGPDDRSDDKSRDRKRSRSRSRSRSRGRSPEKEKEKPRERDLD